jgi:hypothetical protein
MWPLSQTWYGDRLAEPFQPKTVDELQGLLTNVGLTDPFWQIRPHQWRGVARARVRSTSIACDRVRQAARSATMSGTDREWSAPPGR